MPIRRVGPRQGRNDPCRCGSGLKAKKCCTKKAGLRFQQGAAGPYQGPKRKAPVLPEGKPVDLGPEPSPEKTAFGQRLLKLRVPQSRVWAFLETGLFVDSRGTYTEEQLNRWDKALELYEALPEEQRRILAVEN